MMTEELIELMRRRERLLARVERQRGEVTVALRRWEAPLAAVDKGIAVVRFIKAHPLIVAAAVLAVTAIGRRNPVRTLGQGMIAWRAWRSLGDWARRLQI